MTANLRLAPRAHLTTREAIEGEIERLLSALDDMDGDTDLEDEGSDEPKTENMPPMLGGGDHDTRPPRLLQASL